MTNQKLIQKMKTEVQKCLLLDDADKSYWLQNADALPESIVSSVIAKIEIKNKIIDKYLMAAIAADPDGKHLSELKSKIKKIKEVAFAMDQNVDENQAEEDLLKQIQNI